MKVSHTEFAENGRESGVGGVNLGKFVEFCAPKSSEGCCVFFLVAAII